MLTVKIEILDTKIVAAVKAHDAARRLAIILGVGPVVAATARAAVQNTY